MLRQKQPKFVIKCLISRLSFKKLPKLVKINKLVWLTSRSLLQTNRHPKNVWVRVQFSSCSWTACIQNTPYMIDSWSTTFWLEKSFWLWSCLLCLWIAFEFKRKDDFRNGINELPLLLIILLSIRLIKMSTITIKRTFSLMSSIQT